MANRALPIMVINISCEMIYVLEERLVAQDVPAEKRAKVLNDMCKAAFDPEALESMFQPQPLYEQGQLLTLVTHLASASIIRLSENSLRKLFDLVLMTLKYQMMLIKCSPELLAVTLNHLDGVVTTMNINESSLALIEQCRQRLLKHFAATPYGTWDRIRHSIYCVLQDKHTRVSLFLQAKFQTKDGRFFLPRSGPLPPFVSIPGTVTFHRQEGDTTKSYQVSQYGVMWQLILSYKCTCMFVSGYNLQLHMLMADSTTELYTSNYNQVRMFDVACINLQLLLLCFIFFLILFFFFPI
eukprot:m.39554 g.39554  ORF g.39554 m.39554 type:complete len:297 (+) comp10318_c1_seq1:39-929(+)